MIVLDAVVAGDHVQVGVVHLDTCVENRDVHIDAVIDMIEVRRMALEGADAPDTEREKLWSEGTARSRMATCTVRSGC